MQDKEKSKNKVIEKRALTISEAAEYACVSRGTVKNWLVSGILPVEELPGRGEGTQKFIRIRRDDLDEFLDSCYQKPAHKDRVNNNEKLILLPKNN